MRSVIIALLSFMTGFIHTVYSQNYNSLPGLIVTISSDTIYGVIREKNAYNEKIEFSSSDERNFREYFPTDLNSFLIDGKGLFKSIDVEQDSVTRNRVFLLALVEGKISLYYHRDDFYIVIKDGVSYRISQNPDLTRRITEGPHQAIRNIILEDKRFIGIFRLLTQDCPKVFSRTDNLQYDPKSFTRLVSEYNEIMDPRQVNAVNREVFKLNIKIGIRTTLLINDMDNYVSDGRYTNDDFESALCFSAGVVTGIIFSQRFSFQPELLLTQRKASLYSENGPGVPPEVLNYEIYYLELPLSLYYSIPTKKISPSFFAGAVLGYEAADRSEIQTIYTVKTGIDGPEYGMRIGAGITFRRSGDPFIRLEYFYEKTLTNPYMTHMRYHQLANNFSVTLFIN